MKKRPFIITLLSYLYFAAPLFIFLELMWVNGLGVTNIGAAFSYINWHVLLMMALTPIVGFGIWSVKPWGYYLLLAHSILLMLNNIILYSTGTTLMPLWAIIILTVLLAGVIVAFVRKEVYAPYFNPRIRWWEQAARYYYDKMKVIVKKLGTDKTIFEAKSFDLSETGAFLVSDQKVAVGDKFSMELMLSDKSMLYTDGVVVWVNRPKKKAKHPGGFGCRFINANNLFKKRIRFHMMDIGAKIKERSVN